MSKLFIKGDLHSSFGPIYDFIRMSSKGDILFLLGDVGLNILRDYIPEGEAIESDIKKRIDSECQFRDVQIACIHGNHERRPETIETYKEVEWNGGIAYREDFAKNIIFLKDGEIYNIEEWKFLICGGAWSADKEFRLKEGLPWYIDEQPSELTKWRIERKLQKMGWKVDCVLTHTCPYKYIPRELERNKINNSDLGTEKWLDSIDDKLDYKKWYVGHWHRDLDFGKVEFLYKKTKIINP